jgi:hypothetical protein
VPIYGSSYMDNYKNKTGLIFEVKTSLITFWENIIKNLDTWGLGLPKP